MVTIQWQTRLCGKRPGNLSEGELLVERSRDPECDAARALAAKGITGKLTMLDGKTCKPRTVIDIEKAAKLTVKEGPVRFASYESRSTRSPAGESLPAAGVVAAA